MKIKSKITLIVFFLILGIAALLRFGQIDSLPGGLYSDEGANGLDVFDILSGKNREVFFERNFGREGLFFYLLALAVKIFGVGVWQMKIVSGILGIATIIGLYFLTKIIFNRNIALIASLFAACSIPYAFLGRIAFRANMVPFILVFLFYFAIRMLKDKKNEYTYAFLSGTFLALGLYTYISYRIVPFLAFALLVVMEIVYRRTGKVGGFIWPNRKILLTALIAFMITVAPLGAYFYQHPSSFAGRANDVSILNPNLPHGVGYYMARNIGITLIMFNVVGDHNWRHNLSGAPFFDPATGVLFLIGIMIALFIFFKTGYQVLVKKNQHLRETFLAYTLIWGWFIALLIPMMATEEGLPHFLRSIGIIPIIFVFPALGLRALFLRIRTRPIIIGFLLALLFTFVMNYNLWLYYGIAKNADGYYDSYYGDLTLVSNYINYNKDQKNIFLVLDDKQDRTVRFLTGPNNPYSLVLPNEEVKTNFPKDSIIIFPSLSFGRIQDFQIAFPKAVILETQDNRFGKEAFEVYRVR